MHWYGHVADACSRMAVLQGMADDFVRLRHMLRRHQHAPLVPVTELIARGLVLMSKMLGVCSNGTMKCVPSPTTSGSTPRNLSKTTARSPPSTASTKSHQCSAEALLVAAGLRLAATKGQQVRRSIDVDQIIYVMDAPLYSVLCSTLAPTPRPTAYLMTLLSSPTTAWAPSLAILSRIHPTTY